MSFIWIGWPGQEIPEIERPFVEQSLMSEYSTKPVHLQDELADRHYMDFQILYYGHYFTIGLVKLYLTKKIGMHINWQTLNLPR